jgi:hypothetical protein
VPLLGYFLLALSTHVLLLLRPRDFSLLVSVQGCARSAIVDALRLALIDGVVWCYVGLLLVRAPLPLLRSVILVGRAYFPVGLGATLSSVLFIAFAAPSDSELLLNISAGLYVLFPALGSFSALLRMRATLSLRGWRVLVLLLWLLAVRLLAHAYVPDATTLFYNQVTRSHRSVFSS